MTWIARAELHPDVDHRDAGERECNAVNRIGMSERPQDRAAVEHLSELGKQFADLASGQLGGDHAQFAAHFTRRIGLGIDPFQLARRAIQVNQDHRLGLAEGGQAVDRGRGGRVLQREDVGKRQSG